MDGLYQIAEKSNGFTIHIDNARDPIIDDESCPGSDHDLITVGICMSINSEESQSPIYCLMYSLTAVKHAQLWRTSVGFLANTV